jgi:hypothetical protein
LRIGWPSAKTFDSDSAPELRSTDVFGLSIAPTLPGLFVLPDAYGLGGDNIFRLATFNVENYLDAPSGARHVKSPAAQAKVRDCILAMKPDVLALQEMGATNALLDLQFSEVGICGMMCEKETSPITGLARDETPAGICAGAPENRRPYRDHDARPTSNWRWTLSLRH